jgi:hypothetical protein
MLEILLLKDINISLKVKVELKKTKNNTTKKQK